MLASIHQAARWRVGNVQIRYDQVKIFFFE